MYRPNVDLSQPRAAIRADQNSREAGPDGRIHIVFSGRDQWNLTSDERLLFSYRLDRGQWSPFAKNTMAGFQNLPAGPHVFEAIALDSQGNASVTPARLEFSVFASWFRTPGFLLLLMSSTLIIGYLAWLAFRHYRERGKLIVLLGARLAAEAASSRRANFWRT